MALRDGERRRPTRAVDGPGSLGRNVRGGECDGYGATFCSNPSADTQDIARLLEPMGTAAGVDLSARKPGELCGLFDLEPREAVSAAERAELLIELATSRECG